jgi:arylsulfatase A-like enzyme
MFVRSVLLIWVTASLGCSGAGETGPATESVFDRIVFVTIDTLRADHLGAYGYPRDTSPFFDELAARGLLFDRAYASISTTVPSHATMFTSLHPLQHGLFKNQHLLSAEFLTLAELLSERGFATGAFVSPSMTFRPSNLHQGFDTFDDGHNTPRRADGTIDASIEWLAGFGASDRLFLWVHLFDVHEPYDPPEVHLRVFASKPESERRAFVRFVTDQLRVPLNFFRAGVAGLLHVYDRYDGEIHFVDTEIRRLFEAYEGLGLSPETLWIITSDHGQGLGSHSREGHGKHIWDEQVRVPLLFYASERTLGPRRESQIVSHVDLLPTLASLVGAEEVLASQIHSIQGRSLAPLILGNRLEEDPDRTAFIQRRRYDLNSEEWTGRELGDKFALVESRWKYIHRTTGPDELYDLESDPHELRNLVKIAPDRAQRMELRLLARRDELLADSAPEATSVDPETIERLRALGYAP